MRLSPGHHHSGGSAQILILLPIVLESQKPSVKQGKPGTLLRIGDAMCVLHTLHRAHWAIPLSKKNRKQCRLSGNLWHQTSRKLPKVSLKLTILLVSDAENGLLGTQQVLENYLKSPSASIAKSPLILFKYFGDSDQVRTAGMPGRQQWQVAQQVLPNHEILLNQSQPVQEGGLPHRFNISASVTCWYS